jgi:hypothetical protein
MPLHPGGTVRKLLTLTLASIGVVAIAACSKKSAVVTMSDDLKRDLKLASTTQDIRINPDEITPAAKPEVALKIKHAPSGPKAIRTRKPTVLASAAPVEAAEVATDVPDVQVTAPAPAPAPEVAPEAPPLARPSAIPATADGSAGAGAGRVDSGSGTGGVWGAIFGAVIRGGVVGDDDHCDPRSRPGNRRPTDIYSGGINGGMGGVMRGIPHSLPGARRR